jgi:hypothetical protein
MNCLEAIDPALDQYTWGVYLSGLLYRGNPVNEAWCFQASPYFVFIVFFSFFKV